MNAIIEEKVKAMEWEGGFTNKTVWTCLYACYLYNNFFVCLFISLFVFWSFSCEKNLFLEFTIAFENLRKIKIKIYQKKKKKNEIPNMSGKFKKM